MITEVLGWTLGEVGLGLLATCLPTLHFLFKHLSPDWLLGNLGSFFTFRSTGSESSKPFASMIHIIRPSQPNTSRTYRVEAERLTNPNLECFRMKAQDSLYASGSPPGRILVRSSVAWDNEMGI